MDRWKFALIAFGAVVLLVGVSHASPEAEQQSTDKVASSSENNEHSPDTDLNENYNDPENEDHSLSTVVPAGTPQYSLDIDDVELERRLKEDPESLGSISMGFTDAGRLINGVRFPEGANWVVVDPGKSYGTSETIGYLTAAINEVATLYENTPPLRVCHLSLRHGGWFRPHQSHQSGRDVDLAFYTSKNGQFDLPRNWALVRSIIIHGDVQYILLDRRIQKKLYNYASSIGEDAEWLKSIFHAGTKSIFQHVRRHRDHYHVRYFNPRAQELGRRLEPLLPRTKPENNLAIHRIRRGDTLGSLARKYNTTVSFIRKVNQLRVNAIIRAGHSLFIPRGKRMRAVAIPPTPVVVVPARRLPKFTPPLFAYLEARRMVSSESISNPLDKDDDIELAP